ncbi:Sphingolipid C4-hydroxylase sur2 [Recurvomyces mirabilis]|nr:Sphingolipid C4-hydroxylase sur2 [Recurvomyces mirabilis]
MATYTTMDNSTSTLPPLPSYTIKPLPSLLPYISDAHLSLALPIVAYWGVSMIFHFIDEWDLFPQYRLHTPAEVLKRNHVSRWHVFRDVVIQQVIQTIFGLGLAFVDPPSTFGKEDYDIAIWAQRIRLAERAVPAVLGMVGVDAAGLAKSVGSGHAMLGSVLLCGQYPDLMQTVVSNGQAMAAPAFAQWELLAAKTIYHALIPACQFLLAICIVDTWQYFLHRAMHMNKYLYTTFHSRHHRLYVPYAYGALYNHPVEGFALDTLGTGLAYLISGMTVRQSIWFFTMSTIKTVDDHCGYAFPWDPLQHLTSNNAGYHDVHHQSWGIKTNFSQPFFTFWDGLLGTKWVGGDVSARYERARLAAQKKADAEKPLTQQHETPPEILPLKAAQQAAFSQKCVLADTSAAGGRNVLVEEAAEEVKARKEVRRSPRKRVMTNSGLRGFADRVGESLHGKSSGVLSVDGGRR